MAAIAGVNSVARSIEDGVAGEGHVLLGGDLRFALVQREAEPAEHRFLAGPAMLGEIATMRAMVRREDGSDQTLVELKAVDAAYPHGGALRRRRRSPSDELLGRRGAASGAVAPDLLLDRLGLALGDAHSPRQYGAGAARPGSCRSRTRVEGIGFGPRLIVSLDALRDAGWCGRAA